MRFWPLFLALAITFLIPVVALLWMANRAAKAEPIALKTQLEEAQREKLRTLEYEIQRITKEWNVPESLNQVTDFSYFGAVSQITGFSFPVLDEYTSVPETQGELSEQLLQAIRDNDIASITKLTGVSDSTESIRPFIYSASGRNLTFDAWKQLIENNPNEWRTPITTILNNTVVLHQESTSQLLSLARVLKHDAVSFLEKSLALSDSNDVKALDMYCMNHQLLHLKLTEKESVFIKLKEFTARIPILHQDSSPSLSLRGVDTNSITPNTIIYPFKVHDQTLYFHTELADTSTEIAKRQRTFIIIATLITLFALSAAWLITRRIVKAHAVTELKNTLLATATHELKTPLSASQALLETLERGVLSPAEEKEYMSLLTRENQRLSRLVDQFLTFSRTERKSIRREEFPLKELLGAAKDWLHLHPDLAQSEYNIKVELDEDTLLYADLIALQTALINLLDNAVKFAATPRNVELQIQQHRQNLTLSVTNNGNPIPHALQKKIYSPFAQADRSLTRQHEGIGLGLSIVKSVTETHGGTTSLESNTQTTKFTLSLPIIHENS